MDQVQVKIRGMVMTHRYGTLSAGDVLRTDAEFAKHLVEDCGAADYIGSIPQQKTETAEQAAADHVQTEEKPRKRTTK